MKILAIETSCDETAAAVVEDGRTICSSVVASQIEEHRLYGGVVPEIASRRHAEAISGVALQALGEAGVSISELAAVAVTYGPGLIGALLVGVNFAKGLALAAGLPLVPVHHLRGHIAASYLAHPALKPPFLCLVASGGHSHIVRVDGYTDFTVLGRTRDDAAGECFDKAARAMGMPYPGGAALDTLAEEGDPGAFRFPHPRVEGAPYDFSFSGLKTAALNLLTNAAQKGETLSVPDICASFRRQVCHILCDHTLHAAADTGERKIVLAGGVAANLELRRMMKAGCEKAGIACFLPPLELCGDNAAMIGAQAYYELQAGHTAGADLNAVSRLSIE